MASATTKAVDELLNNLRSAHSPDIILEYPPAGHRKVDEWHYAETRCAPGAGGRRNSLTAATQDFRL